jgi:hypothetical protein
VLSTFVLVGAGAVEFVLCHAEVQIAFVEEKKIGEVALLLWHFMTFRPSQHEKINCILQIAIMKIRHNLISHHTIFSMIFAVILILHFPYSLITKTRGKYVSLIY